MNKLPIYKISNRLTTLPSHLSTLLVFALLLLRCSNNSNQIIPVEKTHPNDPFRSTVVESQYFKINGDENQVIEGENGTRIVIPKGAFTDSKGNKITTEIQFELAEALSLEEMILSNLTTTSDEKLLETDGMIYINATANGEPLKIDESNPIYIEIPTRNKKPNMKVYKGIRDTIGNMNWTEPKELEKFLIPVDMSLLDFYPNGFKDAVIAQLPYKNHSEATSDLLDSLYYSLSSSKDETPFDEQPESYSDYQEKYYSTDTLSNPIDWTFSYEKINNQEYEIRITAHLHDDWILVDHRYKNTLPDLDIKFGESDSYITVGNLQSQKPKEFNYSNDELGYGYHVRATFSQRVKFFHELEVIPISISATLYSTYLDAFTPSSMENKIEIRDNCGVDPAKIAVIKSDEYQNTLVSTREFETRLQSIFKSCPSHIIEIYINNLDKDLWELDSMAASTLGDEEIAKDFEAFSKQRLTNVMGAEKYAETLNGYYQKQLSELKAKLNKKRKQVLKEREAKSNEAQEVIRDYNKLLQKREKYRMETYGFTWTKTGWLNIDRGTNPKSWDSQKLEIIVDNAENYDRIHTYIVYTSIKSLYRLNSSKSGVFYVGNTIDKEMLMPKKQTAVAISIGYKNEKPFLAIHEFETGSTQSFIVDLKESSTIKIKSAIKAFDHYKKENNIETELAFMAKLAQEKRRQEKLKQEVLFIQRLTDIALPCCKPNLVLETETEEI